MYEGKTYHLLLIEDNPGDVRLIEEYLNEPVVRFQSNLMVEQSLQAGRKRLDDKAFDLILLDLSLPDSFGLSTFEEIDKVSGPTPVIVLTGLDDEEVGVQTVKSGAQDFLIKKELNASLLSRSISYAIQRNELHQQLKKSEERLREAHRLAQLGNYELDLQTGQHVWSDEIFRIFDMDPEDEEPVFEELMDMIHPEDRYRLVSTIEKVRKKQVRKYLEIRIHSKSGKVKYIYNIINPQKNQDGEVVKIFGTTHDVTKRKEVEIELEQAMEGLRESEARLLNILAQLPLGVGVLNTDGVFELKNERMAEILAGDLLPSRDPEKQKEWSATDGDGNPIPPEQWPGARALRGEEVTPGIEFRLDRDGETRWFNVIGVPFEESGERAKAIGVVQEITERKKAELQQRENERRYRMLFQGTTDEILVFQLDEDREPLPFMEVNDTACKILGYTRKELMQKTLYDIVNAEPQEIRKRIETVFKQGEALHESQHITKDGTTIPLEISVRVFTYKGRHTIISIGRDVMERQELEQQILNISEQERRRIGRDMHDSLGQMLSGVGLIAQNLAKKLKASGLPGADEVQEITDMIKDADQQARTLSRGLVPVNLESNGLDAALHEMTARASKMYDIEIRYRDGNDTLVDDSTKAVHLYRIAQEAINNAVKHGKATSIEVELSSGEGQISLRIQDNGSGFPEPEERGDGMGVRIMRYRSHMIGGNLKINSKQGEGAEIICQIPNGN